MNNSLLEVWPEINKAKLVEKTTNRHMYELNLIFEKILGRIFEAACSGKAEYSISYEELGVSEMMRYHYIQFILDELGNRAIDAYETTNGLRIYWIKELIKKEEY